MAGWIVTMGFGKDVAGLVDDETLVCLKAGGKRGGAD
jgi:hypothetical protein